MKTAVAILALILALGSATFAQQKPQSTSPPPETATAPKPEARDRFVPLKVAVVLTRMKGDKKISSLPYSIGVTANDSSRTSLRMGVDVPVLTTVFGTPGKENVTIPQASYNYRSVGTNIDCRASSVSNSTDLFRLEITVVDTSIHVEQSDGATTTRQALVKDAPAFRSFNSTFTVIMRNGQTTQYTSAVDPVNGEVMKIEVTLEVMK